MRWILALHIISMTCWFAGLFYLPRLFVYHSMSKDEISIERFKLMERKLYYGIILPSSILTLAFGIWLLSSNFAAYMHFGWLHAKLTLVLLLLIYQVYCARLVNVFKQNKNTHSHVYYRWLNEVPTVLLIAIVILVVVRPF
ncbi:protoporphyrinogen oxidase HemJ [soil metagenome]